jgi:hypothetical protein
VQSLDGCLRRCEICVLDEAAALVHPRTPITQNDNLNNLAELLEDVTHAIFFKRFRNLSDKELDYLTSECRASAAR